MSTEAMKLVPVEPTPEMLKAMDECSKEGYDERLYAGHAASVYMAAIDAAPEQPAQQEPVAVRLWDSQWINVVNHDNCYRDWNKEDVINHAVKMTEKYIAGNVASNKLPPAQRKPWVGLTDEERGQDINANFGTGLWSMAEAIEAKSKEKNT